LRVTVDAARCMGHGQCEIATPDHFRLGADGVVDYDSQPPETKRGELQEAVDACPMQAILLED